MFKYMQLVENININAYCLECICMCLEVYIQSSFCTLCTLKTKRFGHGALGWHFESEYKYAALELEVCLQV